MTPTRAAVLFFLLLYWAISLNNLTIVPPVYEDEPWQASTGWKLAQEGVFGSDLFTGFYGMEQHYYGYMPIHPFFLAAVFKTAGLGLFQLRFEPVVMGALVLALTYGLGRRLFGPAVALFALFFLLFVRLTGLTPSQYSGILLIDIARIARYDMVVPVFGLMALHVYLSAGHIPYSVFRIPSTSSIRNTQYAIRTPLYFLAGLLVGLAGLSHLYGLFWLPAVLLLALWQRVGWRNLLALLLGFALPWMVYLLYVWSGLPDWIGQTRDYAPRFGLLDWRWYLSNLTREPDRYGTGLGTLGWHYLLRPGFWLTLILLPVSLLALASQAASQAAFRAKSSPAAAAIVVPAAVFPTLFALFIYLKLANYLVLVIPFGAIATAWGAVTLWQKGQPYRWLRPLLFLLFLAVTIEGSGRLFSLHRAAAQTTPYVTFIAQVHAPIRPQERVLGLHNYWLGLQDTDYRSWVVPLLQRDPRYWSPPLPLSEALAAISPDVILLDRRMEQLFASQPETAATIRHWMAQQGYRPVAVIDDPTYGRLEIYRTTTNE